MLRLHSTHHGILKLLLVITVVQHSSHRQSSHYIFFGLNLESTGKALLVSASIYFFWSIPPSSLFKLSPLRVFLRNLSVWDIGRLALLVLCYTEVDSILLLLPGMKFHRDVVSIAKQRHLEGDGSDQCKRSLAIPDPKTS